MCPLGDCARSETTCPWVKRPIAGEAASLIGVRRLVYGDSGVAQNPQIQSPVEFVALFPRREGVLDVTVGTSTRPVVDIPQMPRRAAGG
jgi:hypothetical protein